MSLLPLDDDIPIPPGQPGRSYYRFDTIKIGTSRFYPNKNKGNATQSKNAWQRDYPHFAHMQFEIRDWEQLMEVDGKKELVKGCRVWRVEDVGNASGKKQGSAETGESEEVPEPTRPSSKVNVRETLAKHSNPER